MEIGVDILDLDQFAEKIEGGGQQFLNNHFLRSEQGPVTKLAGFFCAKEAIFKTGLLKEMDFLSIQIINDHSGKPRAYDKNGVEIKNISLSISHTEKIVVAVAVLHA
jgi:holo-[acyl-carrier-protein] synthase